MLSKEIPYTVLFQFSKSFVWIDRVSSPDLPRTKRAFNHWTTDAVSFSQPVTSASALQTLLIILSTLNRFRDWSFDNSITTAFSLIYSCNYLQVKFVSFLQSSCLFDVSRWVFQGRIVVYLTFNHPQGLRICATIDTQKHQMRKSVPSFLCSGLNRQCLRRKKLIECP